MRKVVFAINMTADGYCGHADGVPDDESYAFFIQLLQKADVLLFGRITYQLMVPYWPDLARNPSETGLPKEFALVFDSLEKVVFSTTLQSVTDPRTRLARASLDEEVRRLREQPGKDIFIDSLGLGVQLAKQGLIDEYHFVVHPVLVGNGPRFFEASNPGEKQGLELLGTQTFRSGVVVLQYRRR